MRGLLDINVLLALADEDHTFHDRAHAWYRKHRNEGWASCPLTENGMVRVMANPNYNPLKRRSPIEVLNCLRAFVENSDHAFWPDDMTLRDSASFEAEKILGSARITDFYLLALAARRRGRLVTFDEGISITPVPGARPANLFIIG